MNHNDTHGVHDDHHGSQQLKNNIDGRDPFSERTLDPPPHLSKTFKVL